MNSMKLKTDNRQKSIKLKVGFFENINKINKSLVRLTKKKRESGHYEQWKISWPYKLKRVWGNTMNYFYANKLANLDLVDKFLRHKLLTKLTWKEIETLNRPKKKLN